jgi:hypothetical protein
MVTILVWYLWVNLDSISQLMGRLNYKKENTILGETASRLPKVSGRNRSGWAASNP